MIESFFQARISQYTTRPWKGPNWPSTFQYSGPNDQKQKENVNLIKRRRSADRLRLVQAAHHSIILIELQEYPSNRNHTRFVRASRNNPNLRIRIGSKLRNPRKTNKLAKSRNLIADWIIIIIIIYFHIIRIGGWLHEKEEGGNRRGRESEEITEADGS